MAEQMDIPARIKRARADRSRHADWIDETLRLALPTYRRINDSTTADDRNFEQDDLFDTTLQTTVEDFASDMISTFTPRHDRWVLFEPAEDLSEGEKAYIRPQLKMIGDKVFAEIERSNYWEAAQECFAFWAVSAMGVAVSDMGPLNALHFQPIEIPDLVIERGPDGSIHGRWREMKLTKAEQRALFGAMFPSDFPPPGRERDGKQAVFEGCDRDWSTPGVERWHYRIVVAGKERVRRTYDGVGSCPIIVCPFRQQSDSAWGPGPAHKATPLARVLDELSYLNLKALQKAVDPPYSHEEDGTSNYEAGIEAGRWYARAPGSQAPEPLLADMRFDASFFQADLMRQAIKRALYQDRPEQPGQTPPTATQWADELAWNTRRKELPRDRCVREWVLPIIERVAWIMAQRGEIPEVKLKGGRVVSVKPVSPLSKAKDLEDINLTGQVLGLAQSVGATKAQGIPINVMATTENLIRTARERHIVMMTDEEVAAEAAMAAAANGGMDVGAA